MAKWYYVYKDLKDGKVKSVEGTENRGKDYPELTEVEGIATKTDNPEDAINRAKELDKENSEEDKAL